MNGVLVRGLEEWPQEFGATSEPVTSGVVAHHLLSCLEAQSVVDSSSGWRKGFGEGGVLPQRSGAERWWIVPILRGLPWTGGCRS